LLGNRPKLVNNYREAAQTIIHSETYYAPQELVDYYQSVIDPMPLLAQMFSDGFTVPDFKRFNKIQNYKRTEFAKNANFYSNGGQKNNKTLLVCFCGARDRIGITAPAFLQRLDADKYDVLMLIDAKVTHFRSGICGFGSNFLELVRNVEISCCVDEYDRVFALGHSMGAFVALRYSQYARCDRAIAIAPSPLNDTYRLFGKKEEIQAFDPLCACFSDRVKNPVIVYSERHDEDRFLSEGMARQLCAGLYYLPNSSDHPTLSEAYKLNRAKGLLNTVLSQNFDLSYRGYARPIDLQEDNVAEPNLYCV
jgi:hypothetical protein